MKLYGSVALQGCGSSQRVTMERAITCEDSAMKVAINARANIIVSYSEWLDEQGDMEGWLWIGTQERMLRCWTEIRPT